MSIQKGKDILLKLSNDIGNFTSIAGLRTTRIGFDAQTVDMTHAQSAGRWRELLAGAGVRSATISGSGLFTDSAADSTTQQIFFAGDIRLWQIILPDFGQIEGAFQITSLEYMGDHDGPARYEISLASAGALTFTPV